MTDATAARNRLRVIIIGGGISGLSAAWYLQRQAEAHDIPLDYTVLESAERWGGKVLTEEIHGFADAPFIVEAGPDSFLTQKPWALQLARELDLSDRLLGTNDAQRNVFVLTKGKPVALPEGVMLVVPTRLMPFARSRLISPLGKLRMALDLLIPPKRDDGDETLADFIRRRFGSEALDKIAEPLMAGIYNAEADKQSIMATFPRFRMLEKQHRSLIRGMLASRKQRSTASDGNVSAFMSFYGGTTELIDALVPQLHGDLRTGARVVQITHHVDGAYHVRLSDDTKLEADVVLLTPPAYATAELVRDLAPQAAKHLRTIRYVSTGTISLAFRTADIPQPLDGFGLVIPGSEQRRINAITVASTKFDHRAPEDYVLMRIFFGGSRSPETMDLDNAALLQTVRDELRLILNIQAEPLFHRVYRWWNANPQYDVGHLDRVEAIEAALPAGLYVTGSPYRGVGLPDCIHQSQQTVEKVIAEFTERVQTE